MNKSISEFLFSLGFECTNSNSDIFKIREALKEVEGSSQLIIGDDIKEIICAYGGVISSLDVYYPALLASEKMPKGDYFFDGFLGGDIYDEYKVYRDFIPLGYVPLSMDSFGDLLLAKVDEVIAPVFYWDHEDGSSVDGDRNLRVYKLAGSINEFILGLCVDGESSVRGKVEIISIDDDFLAKAKVFKESDEYKRLK